MNVCILGATGPLGKALCQSLDTTLGAQLNIAAVARTKSELRQLKEEIASVSRTAHLDVTKDMAMLEELAATLAPLDACIYAVGDSHESGYFPAAVTPPSHRVMIDRVQYELEQHIIGLQMAFSSFIPHMKPGSSFVVIGSDINRIEDEHCPDWLHAGHYASAKAGQRELVRWMRRDPLVKEKGIKVRYLSPDSNDLPLFEQNGRVPSLLLSIEHMVGAIIGTPEALPHQDEHHTFVALAA